MLRVSCHDVILQSRVQHVRRVGTSEQMLPERLVPLLFREKYFIG